MNNLVAGLLLLVGLGIIVWWSSANHRHKRDKFFRDEHMPTELQSASLVLSEERMRCDYPVPLSGQVDQVYRTTSGDLILVDTKTRKKPTVYESDRMQLSSYKVLLNHGDHPVARGVPVRGYGYIRFLIAGRPRYVRVGLASEAQVVALHDRYQQVTRGDVATGGPAGGRRACASCNYRDICPRRL